jgi:hypothetical protein
MYNESNAKSTLEKAGDWIMGLIIAAMLITMSWYCYHQVNDWEWIEVEHKGLIVAKHEEQVSINRMGEFRTEYHALLADGEMLDLTEKEFMTFQVGDSLTWSTAEKQLKEEN